MYCFATQTTLARLSGPPFFLSVYFFYFEIFFLGITLLMPPSTLRI